MSGKKTGKSRGYIPFVLAAAIYTAGVAAFSVGSYYRQRNTILAQEDLLLTHAVHAVDRIMRETLTQCLILAETPDQTCRADLQDNVTRFAGDCGFDLVGAIGYRGGQSGIAVYGCGSDGDQPADDAAILDLLRARLERIRRSDPEDSVAPIYTETMELAAFGQVRMATSHRTLTDDAGYMITVSRSTQQVDALMEALMVRTAGIGAFLCVMVVPLIMLYHLAQSRSSRETAALNAQLQEDFIKLKERESELEDAIHDLERFNAVALGRENRIIELKAEVNALLEQMNQDRRYTIDQTE